MDGIIAGVARLGTATLGGLSRRGTAPALALAALYVAGYLLLDRITFIWALHGLDITPWNPPPALTLALLLVKGLRFLPAVVLAALISSQFVPLVQIPPLIGLAGAVVIAGGYGAATALLRGPLGMDRRLPRARDLVAFIVVASAAAGLVSFGLTAIYALSGIIAWSDAGEAGTQLWIGDAIGAVVLTPPLLLALDRLHRPVSPGRRSWLVRFEMVLQFASIALALIVVFGPSYDRYSFQLFYILFLPVVWVAVRGGLGGAAWAVLVVQAGLLVAVASHDTSVDTIRTFQLLMFAVAGTGLILGAAVGERHRVARALAESQSRLAAILDTAPDGVLTVDAAGSIESVNPAVEQMFLRSARQLLGHSFRELVEDGHGFPDLAASARLPGAGSLPQELEARRSDGSLFPVELTASQFGEPGDEHYTLVLRDVLTRRQAEKRAREHQSEQARVSRLSLAGEMASALAHELNQPLTAITAYGRGCLRLLLGGPADAALMREGLHQIVGQAERAGDIIARLREFLATGTTQRAHIRVESFVEGAIALAQIEAAQNGVEIRTRIASPLPPVLADRIQLEQVLVNLLRNGMEAILGGGGELRVMTVEAERTAGDGVRITVADSGPGVADDLAEHLFEPFVTTKPFGMGLGLAISRSIVEAHGGRLRMMAQSGGGAVFTFDLPAPELAPEGEARRLD